MNSTQLIGQLTADPELRFTSSGGTPVCTIRLAVPRRRPGLGIDPRARRARARQRRRLQCRPPQGALRPDPGRPVGGDARGVPPPEPGVPAQQGDMFTVRLGRTFDAVFLHDAVDYMTSEDDLRQAIETAFVHCRPGGIAVFLPDSITETFVADSDHGGSDGDDGRGVDYLEWSWDPAPTTPGPGPSTPSCSRSPMGPLTSCTRPPPGAVPRSAWLRLVTDAGFAASSFPEVTTEDRPRREVFVGHRLRT